MADLKSNSTVGGAPIWHKGNFPLNPTGDTLLYKTFKVYTEHDKPQAVDNDFVSKANGGTYESTVAFNTGIQITTPEGTVGSGLFPGNGDSATYDTANMDLVSWYGIGIRSSSGSNGRVIVFDSRDGHIRTKGEIETAQQVLIGANGPVLPYHATRKDYVDAAINIVTANAETRVLRSGDTMTGDLTAPNFYSQEAATDPGHVPRFDQIVIKDSIQDFGYYS